MTYMTTTTTTVRADQLTVGATVILPNFLGTEVHSYKVVSIEAGDKFDFDVMLDTEDFLMVNADQEVEVAS